MRRAIHALILLSVFSACLSLLGSKASCAEDYRRYDTTYRSRNWEIYNRPYEGSQIFGNYKKYPYYPQAPYFGSQRFGYTHAAVDGTIRYGLIPR